METIGGYRVIRKLGSGDRAEVFLGRAQTASGAESELAAIKVFRPGVSIAGIDAEIHALSSIDSPHVVRLLDLASGPGNVPTLILQRVASGGLVKLLAERSSVLAGEAVTILAPIAIAVDQLHSLGIVHGHLSPAAVHFDASGAPVLIGFGSASRVALGDDDRSRLPSPAEREADDGVRRDLDSLAGLIRLVLSRVDGPAVDFQVFGTAAVSSQAAQPSAAQLAESIFSLAPALPVSFEQPAGSAASGVGQTLAVRLREGATQAESGAADAVAPRSRAVGGVTEDARRMTRLTIGWLQSLKAGSGSIRMRVWVVAGLGAGAVVVALLLAQAPTSAGQGADPSVAPPGATAMAPEPSVADSAIIGDDPVAAASALLEGRQACFVERSVICLDEVDQSGSAAWQADVDAIRDLQNGGELGSPDVRIADALIERLGGSALVSLGPLQSGSNATASVLIVKTEAGWRIRSMLPAS